MSSSAERARERRRERDLERRAAECPGDRERRLERERERSRVRRSAESPGARERRLERDRERRAAESPEDRERRSYRGAGALLPPEVKYFRWLRDRSGAWGLPWRRAFAIGSLGAAVTQRIRDREGPGPAAAGLYGTRHALALGLGIPGTRCGDVLRLVPQCCLVISVFRLGYL